LALAAGAWCVFSVTLLFSKVIVDESRNDDEFSHVPRSVRAQHHQEPSDERRHHNNDLITIPNEWNPRQALHDFKRNFQPPFGFTMRDLARRVLSRHVAHSNVLVVAPDAQQAFVDYPTLPKNISLDSTHYNASKHSLGGTFVLHARDQGHTTHAMNAGLHQNGSYTPWTTTLDTWWSRYDTSKEQRRPNWILLAVVDPGFGWEDLVWRDSARFLQESTITYIVTAIRSRFVNGTLQMYGIQGVNALLDKRYKIQVLQVSHYHVEFDAETGNDKQQNPTTFHQYGPNALLKTTSDVESLLQWGAQAAERYSSSHSNDAISPVVFTCYLFGTQGLDLSIPSRRHYIRDDSRIEGDESWTQINLYRPVEFYPCPLSTSGLSIDIFFGDQNTGIDVILMSAGSSRPDPEKFLNELSPWSRRMRKKNALFRRVQNVWTDTRRFIHYYCNAHSNFTKHGVRVTSTIKGEYIANPKANERGIQTHFRDHNESGLHVWYDHPDPFQSEGACARYKDAATCETRILPKRDRLWTLIHDSTKTDTTKNLDLLIIMLDPMSRGQLYRSMPQTKAILDELDFVQFTQYSAVGDNSGPNQAALYSGKSLADRDGITNDGKSEWLWDTLRKAGYATLKGEDGCIENSNMLQSLKPNTTHGHALGKMFCFDFNRPNCLGKEPAASQLLRYGKQFIDAYGSTSNYPRQPFAAFLHFVDSHEDTSTLSTLLDSMLASFFREAFDSGKLANATVVVISDHGLHYGPYFQTLSGRRERTEPLLFIRTPPAVRESSKGHIMESNAPLWTTPFDVYQTMIELTVGRMDRNTSQSLLMPLPETRKTCHGTPTIPKRFCDIHDAFAGKEDVTESCPKTPRPPSILSFYADIPKDNRPMLLQNNCTKTQGETFDFENECICGTSHSDIHPCKEHPWGPNSINSTEKEEEYFAVVKCPNRVERLDSRVLRQKEFVDRYRNHTQDSSKAHRSPDILVLEIDSVSKAYAERHLPLTMRLLLKHQLTRDNRGHLHCTDGICALDFERFAVVGANSVANQVPALSGCVVSRYHASCFNQSLTTDKCFDNGLFGTNKECQACPTGTFPIDPLAPCNTTKDEPEKCCTDAYPSFNSSRICRDDTLFENGLQLFRRGPRRHTTWCPISVSADEASKSTPWLFDVAKAQGYITYFGEEFCYDHSPYVTQDNTFPLYTDYEIRNLYCRLQSCLENCEGPWPPMGPHICLERDGENPAFTQIYDIWKAYPDVPKFAFLNGIAAHDYDFEWIKMIASLEAYDVQLATFMERILYTKEFENTIVVVRADHGLQGGPTTVDYSVQVEHREPWTQIIIPQALAGDSLSILATNQDRLATGFDLYHSFRNLMSSRDVAPMPDWSFDMFRDEIPLDRSCQDAKIPDDFCPCEGRGLDRSPHFGVCNVFEPYNDLFCASDLDPPLAPEKS
jgi:hypothetical protein